MLLVCGVCGSGKSTVAAALAAALGWRLVEGDDHHSPANRARLAAARPLSDALRAPWLAAVAAAARPGPAVVACSALRAAYRRLLGPARLTVALAPRDPHTLATRLARRQNHFVGPSLLPSQLETWECPDESEGLGPVLLVECELPLSEQMRLILARIADLDPDLVPAEAAASWAVSADGSEQYHHHQPGHDSADDAA